MKPASFLLSVRRINYYFFVFFVLLVYSGSAQSGDTTQYRAVVDGRWWNITKNPNLGNYNSGGQQPVDFSVWQAADGSWQLWSCIRGTKASGFGRILFRWETRNIMDTPWKAIGIAMEADTTLGEAKGGLQAPYVLKEAGTYYMFYGDWNHICLATSKDGKNFVRFRNSEGRPQLFSGPNYNARDPMVLKVADTFYCYYTCHQEPRDARVTIKSAIYCRTSTDLRTWSMPTMVSAGGSAAQKGSSYGGDSECPFVVHYKDQFILFRNQVYISHPLNTQYSSSNPLDFGINNDQYMVSEIPAAAPEIIKIKNQYYIVALKQSLNGMRMAKLKFVKK